MKVGKIYDVRLKSPSVSETVQDGPMIATERQRKSYVADRSLSVSVTLSDLERHDARGQIFRWISLITLYHWI